MNLVAISFLLANWQYANKAVTRDTINGLTIFHNNAHVDCDKPAIFRSKKGQNKCI